VTAEIQLRHGVVFRADDSGAGCIEFPKGRRFEDITFCGALPGKADNGARAHVNVLSAVSQTSKDKQNDFEHLPVLVVVPAETRYLKGPWVTLYSLFFLPSMLADGCEIDPNRTLVLTMHGSVEVAESDEIMAGSPALPSVNPNVWISLDAPAVATLVGWTHCPDGQRPNAVVNAGCFSSSRRWKKAATYNEELAALLAEDNVTVYGPPYAGIVTSADWFGQWRQFSQRLEDDKAIRDVPIKFQKITPAARRRRRSRGLRFAKPRRTVAGTVVITNDFALAGEVCTYSADFAEPRAHDFDRSLME